jgi:hypothetical protein
MSGQLILGKDVANDNYVPISVDSSGHLDIDVQVADLVMRANDGNDGAGTDRTVKCDANGELQTTTTLAAGHGLATEAKQDTINGTIGDTNSKIDAMRASDSLTTVKDSVVQNLTDGSAKAKIMGLSGGGQYQIATDTSGHLQVDLLSNADTTKATSTNQSTMITSLGSLAGCVSGTELQVDLVNTGNVKFEDISSSLNSGTNDNPPNSLAVGLRARQTITDETTETFLKCNSDGELLTAGGGGGGGDASAANQTTMITHLSEIEGAVETIETCVSGTELQVDVITSALPSGAATEATLSAAEVHLGNIDTATSSIQSNVATSALQTTGNATLVNVENNLSSIQSTVSSNRLQVNTNNADHGTLTQLAVGNGATGANSAILNTAGYSKLVLICKNSTNTSSSIMASLLWSDSATFSGGTDIVMNSDDTSGTAFSPVSFQSANSADSSDYNGAQAIFSLTPPAQYVRVNCFQGTGISINVDFFYILAR